MNQRDKVVGQKVAIHRTDAMLALLEMIQCYFLLQNFMDTSVQSYNCE